MLSRPTERQKHNPTGFTPNLVMFTCKVSERVDVAADLPLEPDMAPSAPECVQHLRERLELLQRDNMTRTAATHTARLVMCCVVPHQRHTEVQEQGEKVPPII